jgi:DNA replication protein DnaC
VASLLPESPAACPVCRGFGLLESEGGRKLVPCRCREGNEREARRRSARIPERYRNCTLTNYRPQEPSQEKAKAAARRFVADYPAVDLGLLFVGPVGVGKTHLAVAVLAELVDTMGIRGVFCDFTDLLARIQATFSRGSEESEDDVLQIYRDAELLVLDELGARRPTDWARDVLYGLLNTRYNRKRVTLLTTNFGDAPEKPGGETLELRVGVPVRSRLAEMCRLVEIGGKDFRREARLGERLS